MAVSLSQRLVARFAAFLLAVSGMVSLANHPLPKLAGMSNAGIAVVSGASVGIAVLAWFLPWDRWPRRALYGFVPLALGLKMLANHLGGVGPYGYGLHFVLIFSWIGLALPQWTSLLTTPLLAVAYLLPLWVRSAPVAEMTSFAVVVPICLLVGESTAWVASRLRRAEAQDVERMRRMENLLQATLELAHRHDTRGLADRIAQYAVELLSGERAVVLLNDPRRMLRGAGVHRWGADPQALVLRPDEHPALARTLRNEEIVWGHELAPALSEALELPLMAALPLAGSAAPLGVVLVALRRGAPPLDSFTRSLARTFATQAGLAVERLRATEALLDASLRDDLTGVGNRRKGNAALRQLNPGDVLMLIDLDHFKQVNDRYGHAAGDAALEALGTYLRNAVRAGDQVFRWGGEEFLMILAGVSDGAEAAGRRLCEGWRRLGPLTTFSAGLAVHRASQDPAVTLVRADAALYAAKEAGRDRVHVERGTALAGAGGAAA